MTGSNSLVNGSCEPHLWGYTDVSSCRNNKITSRTGRYIKNVFELDELSSVVLDKDSSTPGCCGLELTLEADDAQRLLE